MRLIHTVCGRPLTVVTKKLTVLILEVSLAGNGTIKPALLDIIEEKAGKISYSCPRCHEAEIPRDAVGIECPRCGASTRIDRLYNLGGDYPHVCLNCAKILQTRYETTGDLVPIKIRFL